MLFTNSKLFRSGYRTNDLCSFCKQEPETINLFFVTALIHSLEKFWTILFAFEKTIQVELTLKDILIGVFRPECPLLNYLIRIGKIYLWSCRKNEVFLNIDSFKVSVNIKYETKKIYLY